MEELANSQNLSYLEELYEQFLTERQSLAPEWLAYFEKNFKNGNDSAKALYRLKPHFTPPTLFNPQGESLSTPELSSEALLQERVDQLIRAFRVRGHLAAKIDPLEIPRSIPQELDPAFHDLTAEDMDKPFSTLHMSGANVRSLREILEHLKTTYCRSIGVQFMHIDDLPLKDWLQERMERSGNRIDLSREKQLRIFSLLSDAVLFEEFVRKKFLGAKSFSLEGAETLIPLLYQAIEKAGSQKIDEIVIAMAHRGRLNVLANIMGKPAEQIFHEFEDQEDPEKIRRGDVKYHLGHSRDWVNQNGYKTHLSLCFNPSHLEFINPIALGRMRAKQDRVNDAGREKGLTLLIHGDASFAGEGIVQESLNLSQLEGYKTGGTLHVIVNNQIGFTTSTKEGRSTSYATDVARMLQVPIFHVNGEDPEAVAQVVELALDFRKKFKKDVFIDMYCYRHHGHNENDEPSFTQPLMYNVINHMKSIRTSYLEHLLTLGSITREEAEKIESERRKQLEDQLSLARSESFKSTEPAIAGIWRPFQGGPYSAVKDVKTGVPVQKLAEIFTKLIALPQSFHPNPKLKRFFDVRSAMAQRKRDLDWSAAEALAFGTILEEGHLIRFSGQDTVRGTFSQRHAALIDVENAAEYIPLNHLSGQQAKLEIINSPLSEAGVLGFEYGYSLDYPEGLILWEAQFGDFENAAQVIIDQFITSAEEKWTRLSGLVLLLPHAFEGQGSEHSSARLERFLQLSAKDNIQVANVTTPAQYFHILRRQVLRSWRKPLIIMTPKSLLRHPKATSKFEDLESNGFSPVLADREGEEKGKGTTPTRVLLCSGKVYYDLAEKRETAKAWNVRLIRLEQLYPFPKTDLETALAVFPKSIEIIWVQEEPRNMGAWLFIKDQMESHFPNFPHLGLIARPEAASPATGSHRRHEWEQEKLMEQAFSSFNKGSE